jgi:hypothetical protein
LCGGDGLVNAHPCRRFSCRPETGLGVTVGSRADAGAGAQDRQSLPRDFGPAVQLGHRAACRAHAGRKELRPVGRALPRARFGDSIPSRKAL